MSGMVETSSAVELAAAIRSRELSSVELLDRYLDRIEKLNPLVNAVVTLDAERARADAAAADEEAAAGRWRGPLHGLPMTIKDAIAVGGMRSTGGAVELRDHVPAADAPAVARLREAGAIVFGKTNVPRWSADLQTFNEVFGTTNNPWAFDRTPGGSSGGAAAAVACGFTAFELGTDIGGSVRIPSHCCGVFGLKPSYGVIPQRGYLSHVTGGVTDPDINVFGPIARSAADLDLVLGVAAGPEPERAPAWRLELPAPRKAALADHRIGVWFDELGCPVDGEVAAVLRATADRLSDAGVKLEEAHPPVSFADQNALFSRMLAAAMSPTARSPERDGGNHRTWLLDQEQRAGLVRVWAAWFETYDILLCPVMPLAAFPHQQHEGSRLLPMNGELRPYGDAIGWTGLIGAIGLPAAVPPLARTATRLPVGMQVVAPYLRDREAVHVAGMIAEVAGGYEVPPGFSTEGAN